MLHEYTIIDQAGGRRRVAALTEAAAREQRLHAIAEAAAHRLLQPAVQRKLEVFTVDHAGTCPCVRRGASLDDLYGGGPSAK